MSTTACPCSWSRRTPRVWEIVRNVGLMGEREPGGGMHALIHYDGVRVPAENLLGGEGQAFVIAQTRLGGGRVHHAMRTVGMARRALDMLAERAVSRRTRDGVLADKQSVRDMVADTYIELTQFRLLVLYVAWCIDQTHDYRAIRPGHRRHQGPHAPDPAQPDPTRGIQVHGALGVSDELPLGGLWMTAPIMGLVDGPTEVHRTTVARQVLKEYQPVDGLWPSQHLPTRRAFGSPEVRRPPRCAGHRRRRQPAGAGRGRRARGGQPVSAAASRTAPPAAPPTTSSRSPGATFVPRSVDFTGTPYRDAAARLLRGRQGPSRRQDRLLRHLDPFQAGHRPRGRLRLGRGRRSGQPQNGHVRGRCAGDGAQDGRAVRVDVPAVRT